MATNEDREAKETVWLQRLQEAAAAKESLVEYPRRHGLKLEEAYRWTQILRRAGQWPARAVKKAITDRSKRARKAAKPRFVQVRIATARAASVISPLRLQLQLVNGRRAEIVVDEEQLPRVLKLLEQTV